MVDRTYIGIDNGVTGSIAFVDTTVSYFFRTPIRSEQDYTKKKKNITRIDLPLLLNILRGFETHLMSRGTTNNGTLALIERPYVNPGGLKATISAVRSLEATMIALEMLSIPYQFIDSKEWQRELLPAGTKGTPELKKASRTIGLRLFPGHADLIARHKDADSLLIAEWGRRNNI